MRIIISGSRLNTNTIGAFMLPHLTNHQTEILTFHDEFGRKMASPGWRLAYRIAPQLLVSRMNELLVSQVRSSQPDVVIIFKGMEISASALQKIRKMGVPLVNYNFDHPFRFFSRGSGNQRVRQAIPLYNLHLSYSAAIAKELNDHFHVAAAWLPFAHHLSEELFNEVITDELPEVRELCFVGNPDVWRINLIRDLLGAGLAVNVYGFGWEKYFGGNEGLVIHRPRQSFSYWANPAEFWRVLRKYRIQINIFRPHNEGSHNLRTFEVPAVGGVLLTPDSAEQREFFNEEREVFYWRDGTHLLEQCHRLLAMPEAEVRALRERARAASIQHSYAFRTRQMVDIIQQKLF